MSQNPRKRDIADFFRPCSRSISEKRRCASTDGDTITVQPVAAPPRTPSRVQKYKNVTPSPRKRPLETPQSGQTLLMPIRSPYTTKIDGDHTSRTTRPTTPAQRATQLSEENIDRIFKNIPNAGQKVVREGVLIAVRDSDDDTDSLESLSDIFGKKGKDDISSDSSPLEEDEAKREAERVDLLKTWTHGRSDPIIGKGKLRALLAKDRAKKFDISRILDDHFGDEETEQNVLQARRDYEANAKELEASRQSQLDSHLLAAIVQGQDAKPEDVARVLDAMERTEALSSDKVFSFFKFGGLDNQYQQKSPRSEFPWNSIPQRSLANSDAMSRLQLLKSGYLRDLGARSALPDEALRWMFHNAVSETAADLRHAYIQCLQAGSFYWTRNNLTASDVQSAFQVLGADPLVMKDGSTIESKHYNLRKPSSQNPDRLLATLEMFNVVCQDMDFTALSKLCSIVSRLAVDVKVMSDGRISSATETLLETLLNSPNREARSHIYDRIMSDLGTNLCEPFLQSQFLNHILPTSPLAIELRQDLALRFLLGPPAVPTPPSKPHTLDLLTSHISTSPSFSTTQTSRTHPVDYASLTSSTHILDTAIADGNPPSSHPPDQIPTFNASVDALADQIHRLFVSIADSGATHMRRTEAKDALQALHFRLLYAVRTKPRRKKHVFDAGGAGSESGNRVRGVEGEEWRSQIRGMDFMKKFLNREDGSGGDV